MRQQAESQPSAAGAFRCTRVFEDYYKKVNEVSPVVLPSCCSSSAAVSAVSVSLCVPSCHCPTALPRAFCVPDATSLSDGRHLSGLCQQTVCPLLLFLLYMQPQRLQRRHIRLHHTSESSLHAVHHQACSNTRSSDRRTAGTQCYV